MEGYVARPVHIPLQKSEGYINLDEQGYVMGVSVEVEDDSSETNLYIGFNSDADMKVQQGDDAREYGGFQVHNVPCCYRGKINYKFTGGDGSNPRGLIILTILISQAIDVPCP